MTAQPLDAPRGFVSKAEHYRALDRIETLQEQVSELSEALSEARGERLSLKVRNAVPALTEMQACFVAALYQACPRLIAMGGLYESGSRWKRKTEVEDCYGLVKTHIHYARRKLAALGAPQGAIVTAYGSGYRLSKEAHQWLSERIYGGEK